MTTDTNNKPGATERKDESPIKKFLTEVLDFVHENESRLAIVIFYFLGVITAISALASLDGRIDWLREELQTVAPLLVIVFGATGVAVAHWILTLPQGKSWKTKNEDLHFEMTSADDDGERKKIKKDIFNHRRERIGKVRFVRLFLGFVSVLGILGSLYLYSFLENNLVRYVGDEVIFLPTNWEENEAMIRYLESKSEEIAAKFAELPHETFADVILESPGPVTQELKLYLVHETLGTRFLYLLAFLTFSIFTPVLFYLLHFNG